MKRKNRQTINFAADADKFGLVMAMMMTAKCVYLSATSIRELSHGFSCDKIVSNCPLGGKVLTIVSKLVLWPHTSKQYLN